MRLESMSFITQETSIITWWKERKLHPDENTEREKQTLFPEESMRRETQVTCNTELVNFVNK